MAPDTTLPNRAEVVVIGGGITGCAAAYYLARNGGHVVVLDRGEIAGAQSSRAWGFVRQQGRHPAEVPYAAQASRIWEGLSGELQADLEFVRGGILAPAETPEDEARMQDGARIAAENGLSTRLLSRREMEAVVPELRGSWRAGLYTAEDAHAEPRKATEAFAAAAERRGARLFPNTGVSGFLLQNGSIGSVVTTRGEIKADVVVCAAGLGTSALLRKLGTSLPIHAMRVSVAETEATAAFTKVAVWAPRVAFRPTQRNTFYIGSGYRGKVADVDLTIDAVRHARLFLPQLRNNRANLNLHLGSAMWRSLWQQDPAGAGPQPAPNPEIIRYNLEQFFACFPHLAGLEVRRRWAGEIDVTPDMLPIIGPAPRVANMIVAAGFSGHGFALGPASGKLLAALVKGDAPGMDLRPFRPTRFAENDFNPDPNAF